MVAKTLLILLGLLLLHQVVTRLLSKTLRRHLQVPAPAFLGRFLDSDVRRWLQPPDEVIQRSGIREGMQVIDLGCGSGAFTFSIARAVGRKGKVYAIDIQPKMLTQLETKLRRKDNEDVREVIEILNRSAYELPYGDESIDACCMISVLQEIPDRQRALREVKRVLKPGGTLAVTEFVIDPDYALKSTTIKLATESGFLLGKVYGNFANYTVCFKKP